MGPTRAERFVFGVAGVVLLVSAVLAVQQRLAERAALDPLAAALPGVASAAEAGDGPAPPGGGAGAGAGASGEGGAAPAGGQGEPPGALVVHVAGAVAKPGVYRLPQGARVADAVAAAGGATARAWLDAINLAAPLADGVQVLVPARGEAPPSGAAGGGGGSGGVGSGTTRGLPVDLNTADVRALEALPGIGPALAARIVEHRTRHGRFRRLEDLLEVPGIGPRTLERLRPHVTVR